MSPIGPTSHAAAAPDILRRIVARRRQRLSEYRARHPEEAAAVPPLSTAAAVATPPLACRDNRFLAALAGHSRAGVNASWQAEIGASRPVAAKAAAVPAVASPAHPAPHDRPAPPAPPARWAPPAIIAEVKMGSPRLGSLRGRLDPLAQARIYAAHGAAALSVVVEPDFFHGSYELLADCRAAAGLPAVAKDFVVDPLQLAWARQAGADAVLLIAALYEPEELAAYAWLARGLGLAPLIETHDAADLACLAGEPWELVGVNNRDLRTFEVDLERSIALLPSLPRQALKVSESGIRDALDVALLADSGFDALLIGESLLLAADPAAALRALLAPGSGSGELAEERER